MSEISVRALGEEDWQEYREIRLEALKESPEAFVATHDEESGYEESRWRDRMNRSRRLLATVDEAPTGVVCVGRSKSGPDVAELFGLWVRPDARGTGVAWRLVEAGAHQAREDGRTHLAYWVGTDNGRAVAFASSFGFRPTENRRPMRVPSADGDGDETEIAMVLPLGSDPGAVPSSLMH
jgi:GNAT superfamily N-acetyltransferase